MKRKSSRGVVCLSLVAGFFMAAPSSQRPPLNPSVSAFLTRAEEPDNSAAEPDLDLKSDKGSVCSGTPDYAKGVTSGSSQINPAFPVDVPVFEKDRKSAVLSLIRYPWKDLGYDIVFMGARPGYRAMTLTGRRRIEIYVRPEEGIMNQAYDLAHELGHAFDLKYNDDERRRKWCELRGIKPSTPWFGCDACPDYRTPAGDFAETFAFLLLGPGNYHSLIAPLPKIEQVEELAKFCKIEKLSDVLLARLPHKTDSAKVQSAKVEKRVVRENKPEEPSASVAKSVIAEPAPEPAAMGPETTPETPEVSQSKPSTVENTTEQESPKVIEAPKADVETPSLAPAPSN